MTQPKLILISGLPRSGKTSLATALVSEGFTHVPLDRYFRPLPAGMSFLEWMAFPECIDWPLLERHLAAVQGGETLVAPLGIDVSWGAGGIREGGRQSRRVMARSEAGYAVPGCYAFECPLEGRHLAVFVRTPRRVIAERALLRDVTESEAESVLDAHLSSNWRTIERYEDNAEVVVSGLDSHDVQIAAIRSALASRAADL